MSDLLFTCEMLPTVCKGMPDLIMEEITAICDEFQAVDGLVSNPCIRDGFNLHSVHTSSYHSQVPQYNGDENLLSLETRGIESPSRQLEMENTPSNGVIPLPVQHLEDEIKDEITYPQTPGSHSKSAAVLCHQMPQKRGKRKDEHSRPTGQEVGIDNSGFEPKESQSHATMSIGPRISSKKNCSRATVPVSNRGTTKQPSLEDSKKERRREQNRRAANKCRYKRKREEDKLKREHEETENERKQKMEEIKQLYYEVQKLEQVLRDHMKKGDCRINLFSPFNSRELTERFFEGGWTMNDSGT